MLVVTVAIVVSGAHVVGLTCSTVLSACKPGTLLTVFNLYFWIKIVVVMLHYLLNIILVPGMFMFAHVDFISQFIPVSDIGLKMLICISYCTHTRAITNITDRGKVGLPEHRSRAQPKTV